ncbi:MAG TPA: tetratricopeptide repeat protein [Thermoanaerobaculia bacterium]|nr:tetratricopeptide repeat protein [Thermoanaerobaculia bacterium]
MSLERIEITPFAVIVGDILQNRRTGYLTLIKAPTRKVLYWSQGELVLVTSASPTDSLADFLVRRGIVPTERAAELVTPDPTDAVARFHEAGMLELSWRQTLLREWVAAQFIPLFSLDEGTAAFTEDAALEPEKRVFLQSTAAQVIEGVRSITNGLVLRRSLGELKRDIGPAKNSRFSLDTVPLTDGERKIAGALQQPESIEVFLKHFASDSVTAAKVVISMLILGLFSIVESRVEPAMAISFDDMQRDLELLAVIGSSDQRSLRAVGFSRQLASMDHYQVVDVPRAATRAQIMNQVEEQRKKYDPATYPPIVREAVNAILRRIEEATNVLKDAGRRASYDKLMQDRGAGSTGTDASIQQRLTQKSIADQNFARAQELAANEDYYGAIVLLKQAVEYTPDNAQAWYLLGSCQERNPKWLRDAAESFQMALSVDPNFIDAMISLGDLYKAQGLVSRAQSCYEDVIKIAAENQQAKSRLHALRKR